MKTDEYFYEFFRKHPAELLRLIGYGSEGPWHFESITVKQLQSLNASLEDRKFLIEALLYAIVQRFPGLDGREFVNVVLPRLPAPANTPERAQEPPTHSAYVV